MKVFQVVNDICHWDATSKFPTAGSTVGFFPSSVLFVETPDYVFEGWGFDASLEGDERFIQPEPPEGWLYDDATGTFYPEGEPPAGTEPTEAEDAAAMLDKLAQAYREGVNEA